MNDEEIFSEFRNLQHDILKTINSFIENNKLKNNMTPFASIFGAIHYLLVKIDGSNTYNVEILNHINSMTDSTIELVDKIKSHYIGIH